VLEYTRLGKSLRAAADNPTAATYMGIDVDRAWSASPSPWLRLPRWQAD
jgi:branched-subunit amino acid ABC-type transport system permease component